MGIVNTTTSSALAAVFLGAEPAAVTGRGAGLSSEGMRRKVSAIERAIEKNRPDPADPIGVLQKVGGLDLAGLCGVFIGGAAAGVPVPVSYTHLDVYKRQALDYAVQLGFAGILLVGHMGKLCKLAGGIMNTHSHVADARMEPVSYTHLTSRWSPGC